MQVLPPPIMSKGDDFYEYISPPPDKAEIGPPWRQPRGKCMVSLVNSHTNATSKR